MANTNQTPETPQEEAPQAEAPQPVTQAYWVPEYNVSVEAASLEEATAKAKKVRESQSE